MQDADEVSAETWGSSAAFADPGNSQLNIVGISMKDKVADL